VAFARTPSSFLPSSLPLSLSLAHSSSARIWCAPHLPSFCLNYLSLTHTLTNTHSGTQAHIRTHKCLCMHVYVHIACCALASPG
jgi:hypothetical protein